MGTNKTTLDTLYLVKNSSKKVEIEIAIGDTGQTSLLNMTLDETKIVENHAGNLEKMPILENNLLNGKKLKIVATVTDTSRETNVTYLNIKISGGFLTRTYPLYKMVSEEGDSADYYCQIEFYNPSEK
ncbi:hypothetical protein FLJC2902T_12970 [Flavobacterium limnosediminis JC2902]|uniref:Uncharacterized protein n=1 Tax=Flavobacterium limnosediminis JC2902 TaxID=1341181 RepID=V6SQ18_9FLAO|nr:hypothetical protein [Flavobacterium limnosediminis]ESU28706.1 hypothetical protein FLJC2902T_12970 [Flavobacterium limnosediminis JC2902]